MTDFVVVIPSRYASVRLPGKPLIDIAGKPMIRHVHERACESRASEVVIATDDERIADVAESLSPGRRVAALTNGVETSIFRPVEPAEGRPAEGRRRQVHH